MNLWDTIADEAAGESRLWAMSLRSSHEREPLAVFSPLGQTRYALGLETIYEGYLLHYGRARLFAPADRDTALLLGDYLYAHGLVRISSVDPVAAVGDLAALISLCAQAHADGTGGDGEAWAATASALGLGRLDEARRALRETGNPAPLTRLARSLAGDEAVDQALLAHRSRVG